jgi:hypothetical protein
MSSTREQKIIKYITEKKQIKSIRNMCSILGITNRHITIEYINNLCEKYNLKCSFIKKHQYEHGYHTYLKGCKCNICILANNLSCYAVNHFGRSKSKFVTQFANENIKLYESDKTRTKQSFFKFFSEKFKIYLENLPVEITRLRRASKQSNSDLIIANG